MKAVTMIAALFFAGLVCVLPASAQQSDHSQQKEIMQQQYDASGADSLMDSLPDGVSDQLQENGITSPSSDDVKGFSIPKFFSSLWDSVVHSAKQPLILLACSFGTILLCSLFEAFRSTVHTSLSGVLNAVASLSICGILLTPVIHCVELVSGNIKGMGNFMLCFIPVFTGLMGASGAPTAALSYNTALFTVMQIISTVTSNLLLPFIGMFLALSICSSISGQFNISSLTGTVRKVVIWGLTLMVTIFCGLFAAQSMVSVSADSVAVKTAKFMSGSFIPVVGNALGDAVGSIFACLGVIKTSVGAFGIIVCLLTFLPPILLLLFYMVVFKLSGSASEILSVKGVSSLFNSVYDTLTILLSFLICYAVITIVTTTLMISISAR